MGSSRPGINIYIFRVEKKAGMFVISSEQSAARGEPRWAMLKGSKRARLRQTPHSFVFRWLLTAFYY